MSHSDDLNALLAIDEPVVDLFDTVRIFEGSNGIREIHAVLAKIFSRFAIIPFVLHACMVPDTRSGGKAVREAFYRGGTYVTSGERSALRRKMVRPTRFERVAGLSR